MEKETKKDYSKNFIMVMILIICILITIGYSKRDHNTKNTQPRYEQKIILDKPCYGDQECISKVRENFINTGKRILGEEYIGEGKFGISFMDSGNYGMLFNAVVLTDCNCNVTNVSVSNAD